LRGRRLQLPALTQARKASTGLAALAEMLESVAPDCMKAAKLLQKHAESALGKGRADAGMRQQVTRCVGYITSLEDCGRMTLDSKSVAKLLADAESCELTSGLTSPLDMLQGILDTCSKIQNLPDHVHHQLSMLEEEMPEQVTTLAADYPKLASLAGKMDDIVSQIVAATMPLRLDERQVKLAVSGVEAVGTALSVLKELPRVVEPLVEKLDMVGEVVSMGARAARDLSQSVKRRVREMHRETPQQRWARKAAKRARRCCHHWRQARSSADFSWAPLLIISMYVLGMLAGAAGVVLFTAALVQGFADSLPSLGIAGVVCFIAGILSCILGVLTSFVLRGLARVDANDADEEQREMDQAVREIKQARREGQRHGRTAQGRTDDGEIDVEAGDGPPAEDTGERLIFGDSDKGLVAEMQALGANVMYAEDVLSAGSASATAGKGRSKGKSKGKQRLDAERGLLQPRTTAQEVLQGLFVEGRTQSTSKPAKAAEAEAGPSDESNPFAAFPGMGGAEQVEERDGAGGEAAQPSSAALLMNIMGDSGPATEAGAPQAQPQPDPQAQLSGATGFTMAESSADAEPQTRASAEELTQYARYLGMDPVFDADLLWIAEQAYYAPLPANWQEAADADGNIYYFNSMTGVTTWSHPLEDHFRSLFLQMKADKTRAKGGAKSSGTTQGGARRQGGHPFGSPRQHHHLDDTEMEAESDGDSSLGTSLSLSQSAASVRGKHQQWDLSGSQRQPFIRSYGASGDLGSTLSAARAAAALPPPLPDLAGEVDAASAPVGKARRGRGGKPRASLLSSESADDGTSLLHPVARHVSSGWVPPAQ